MYGSGKTRTSWPGQDISQQESPLASRSKPWVISITAPQASQR